MRRPSALGGLWKRDLRYLPTDLRNRRNLARGGYSSSPVLDLQGQARRRHSFREFLHRGWRRARTTGGERQGREVAGGPPCSTPRHLVPRREPTRDRAPGSYAVAPSSRIVPPPEAAGFGINFYARNDAPRRASVKKHTSNPKIQLKMQKRVF